MEALHIININQLLITALSLTAAGVIGFWLKDFPPKLYQFIKRQCVTTIDITSFHNCYYNLMTFLEENYSHVNFRNFKLINGKWGDDEITTIGIGYGGHFIKFDKSIFYLNLSRQDSQGTSLDKETVTITKLGRSKDGFMKLIKIIATNKKKEGIIQIYRMNAHWFPMTQIPKRPMETVFIEKFKKDILLKTINDFINNERWYLDNGVPYHLGILLYGNPGTGKSSLIRAIASYVNYDIYYLSVSQLYKIEESMCSLPKKSIIVIEDIDCERMTHNRGEENQSGDTQLEEHGLSTINDRNLFFNFSDALNAIDGICSSHGRIMITTTNHISKLDPALIRPGRIDLKVEIDYVRTETFNQFTNRFFATTVNDIALKEKLTCAELQDLLLQNKSLAEILEYAKA